MIFMKSSFKPLGPWPAGRLLALTIIARVAHS